MLVAYLRVKHEILQVKDTVVPFLFQDLSIIIFGGDDFIHLHKHTVLILLLLLLLFVENIVKSILSFVEIFAF